MAPSKGNNVGYHIMPGYWGRGVYYDANQAAECADMVFRVDHVRVLTFEYLIHHVHFSGQAGGETGRIRKPR